MASFSTEDIRPRILPDGFQFRRRIEGETAPGFWGTSEQVTLIHTRGGEYADWNKPLHVHVTTQPDAQLAGTENRPGIPLDLGIEGVRATYHDGMWADAGPQTPAQWRTDLAHSITVRFREQVFGIRGPREMSVEELTAVARSLPL